MMLMDMKDSGRFPRIPDGSRRMGRDDDDDEFTNRLHEVYSGPNDDFLSEPEREEESLKKIVQSDALRAYGFMRKRIIQFNRIIAALKTFMTPKRLKLATILAGMLVVSLAGLKVVPGIVNRFSGGGVLGEQDQVQPDFSTIGNDNSGGEVQFDPERGVATIQTDFDSAQVTISQQNLPEDFRTDPDQLEKVARSLIGTVKMERFSTRYGLAYLMHADNSAQTVIFNTDSLLVFITSNSPHDPEAWIGFIDSLE